MRKPRSTKLKCKPGFVQRGAACQPDRPKKEKPPSKGRRKSTGIVGALATAAVAGAGAMAIAKNRGQGIGGREQGEQAPSISVPQVSQKPKFPTKSAVIAGAATVGAVGAGAVAMANRKTKAPQPSEKMPPGTKVKYKAVPDPWDETDIKIRMPDVETKSGSNRQPTQNPTTPTNTKPQFPKTADPWEGTSKPRSGNLYEEDTPQVEQAKKVLKGAPKLPENRQLAPSSRPDRPNPSSVEVVARRNATAEEAEAIKAERRATYQAASQGKTKEFVGNRTEQINRPQPESGDVMVDRLLPGGMSNGVKAALKVEGFDEETTAKLENVLTQVDKVVKIPQAPSIPVKPIDSRFADTAAGEYRIANYTNSSTGETYAKMPHHIGINDGENARAGMELATVHEVGHYIDHVAFGDMKKGHSTDGEGDQLTRNPALTKFLATVADTKAIKDIVAVGGKAKTQEARDRAEYLLAKREVFARAFAQYVAKKSGSKVLKSQIKAKQQGKGSEHWDDKEFAKVVEPAMDELFKEMGWR